MQALFVVDRIQKRFGARKVLDIETLELSAGRSYALTGDNGAGKTTLLRVLAGLEEAQLARGRYLGREIDFRFYPDWLRRDVIYVHQHPYLFRASVKDNIAYGLKARGTARKDREHLVAEALSWAKIEHLLESPAQRLSAGEKQRVALARARVLKPRLFLLDEPTASLDEEARVQTRALIADLCDANGTALIACHDRELLQMSGMRRLHLSEGRIELRDQADAQSNGLGSSDAPVSSNWRVQRADPGGVRWRPVAND
jgi:tungstate transport system ATP-binding protein